MIPIILKLVFSRTGAYIALAAAVLGAVTFIYYEGKSSGKQEVIDDIRKGDQKILRDADEAARRVNDCHALGRVWDRATGKCLERVPGVPR